MNFSKSGVHSSLTSEIFFAELDLCVIRVHELEFFQIGFALFFLGEFIISLVAKKDEDLDFVRSDQFGEGDKALVGLETDLVPALSELRLRSTTPTNTPRNTVSCVSSLMSCTAIPYPVRMIFLMPFDVIAYFENSGQLGGTKGCLLNWLPLSVVGVISLMMLQSRSVA